MPFSSAACSRHPWPCLLSQLHYCKAFFLVPPLMLNGLLYDQSCSICMFIWCPSTPSPPSSPSRLCTVVDRAFSVRMLSLRASWHQHWICPSAHLLFLLRCNWNLTCSASLGALWSIHCKFIRWSIYISLLLLLSFTFLYALNILLNLDCVLGCVERFL